MPNENACEYGGVKYSEGSEICQGGRMMVCQGGTWNPTGASCAVEDEGKEITKEEKKDSE